VCDGSGVNVSSRACHKNGLDMAKWLRSLEADLTDLGVNKRQWKRILSHKLSAMAKEVVVDIIERKDCTCDLLKDACLRRIGKKSDEGFSKI